MRCNSLDEQTMLLSLFGNRALYLITIVFSSARCLYLMSKFTSALTKHLLLYPCDLPVCVLLHSVYVLKHNVASQYNRVHD